MSQDNRANFGSKLGIILATAGSAVGLGNIWRFPYLAGENGGAAFMLIYIGCIILLGIPCMLGEFIVGRNARTNAARAFRKLAPGTPWTVIGYMGIVTGVLIISYYSVVAGWCTHYVYASVVGELQGDKSYFADYFDSLSTNPLIPILWAFAVILITHFVIARGVQKGIEKASKLMMPTLFILLLVIVVCSCTLPGAWKGIAVLFTPDFSKVTGDPILAALGQTLYSISIGMGTLITYASYFKKDTDLVRSAMQIGIIDLLVAILAGLMIFPAAFAVGVSPDSGPSLIFITLHIVFQLAFGGLPLLAMLISLTFYILLTLAALTSLISMHEVATAYLHEEKGMSRNKAACIVTALCMFICIFCSLSLGNYDWLVIFDKSLFDWFDFTTGQLLLPFGGLLVTLFVCRYLPEKLVRDEYTNGGTLRSRSFKAFYFCAKYVCPICIVLIFLKGMGVI